MLLNQNAFNPADHMITSFLYLPSRSTQVSDEQKTMDPKISLAECNGTTPQMVSIRNHCKIGSHRTTIIHDHGYTVQDFAGTLQKVSEIGYDQVEFSALGLLGRDPKEVKDLLTQHGLKAPVGRVAFDVPPDFMSMPREEQIKIFGSQGSMDSLKSRIKKSIAECQILEQKWLIIPAIMPHAFSDLQQVKKMIALLQEMSKVCQDEGITLGYHNHNWEFDEVEGHIPYHMMLDQLDPEHFTFQLDTYWVKKAEHSIDDLLTKYSGRFVTCHLKDIDAEGDFEDVGHGEIDFANFLKEAIKQGAHYFFVERDTSPDPMQSIQRSYEYLKELTF